MIASGVAVSSEYARDDDSDGLISTTSARVTSQVHFFHLDHDSLVAACATCGRKGQTTKSHRISRGKSSAGSLDFRFSLIWIHFARVEDENITATDQINQGAVEKALMLYGTIWKTPETVL